MVPCRAALLGCQWSGQAQLRPQHESGSVEHNTSPCPYCSNGSLLDFVDHTYRMMKSTAHVVSIRKKKPVQSTTKIQERATSKIYVRKRSRDGDLKTPDVSSGSNLVANKRCESDPVAKETDKANEMDERADSLTSITQSAGVRDTEGRMDASARVQVEDDARGVQESFGTNVLVEGPPSDDKSMLPSDDKKMYEDKLDDSESQVEYMYGERDNQLSASLIRRRGGRPRRVPFRNWTPEEHAAMEKGFEELEAWKCFLPADKCSSVRSRSGGKNQTWQEMIRRYLPNRTSKDGKDVRNYCRRFVKHEGCK